MSYYFPINYNVYSLIPFSEPAFSLIYNLPNNILNRLFHINETN